MRKKILIINTGGTISSATTPNGFTPKSGIVSATLQTLPELQHPDMPDYQLYEFEPLVDSSNITLKDWNAIAQLIVSNYSQVDGFVILHGTDTMAYTASALSFMLENLNKPLIITGAQIPLSELRSDGQHNLITSLFLAQSDNLHEVCVYFNQKLLRGNRSQKVNAYEFSAFDSPNASPLAVVGTSITWNDSILLKKNSQTFSHTPLKEHFIANFRLFPSFSTEVLKHLLRQPLKGLILETYGSGNAQDNDQGFLKVIKDACKRDIIIINCSQCHHGMVNMNTYATGHALKQLGVISGYNMTPEAAHCKLLYLLSKYDCIKTIKQNIEHPLRGELNL